MSDLAERLRASPVVRTDTVLNRARRWWLQLGLAGRWVVVSVALVLAMQALVMWLVQVVMAQQAQQRVQDELNAAEGVLRSLLDRETARLHEGAVLLAAHHGFRLALERNDSRAMELALQTEGKRIGAPITAVLDPDLQLRSTNQLDPLFMLWAQDTAYPGMPRALSSLRPGDSMKALDGQSLANRLQLVALQATADRRQATLGLLGEAPYRFVVAPVLDAARGVPLAWVLMGFPLQQSLATELRQTLAVQMAVLATPQGGRARVVFETLGAGPLLAGLSPQARETEHGGERLVLRQQVMPALGGDVRVVLMRSQSAVMAPFRELQGWLAVVGLVGLALFVGASLRSSRHITAPLRTLQSAARALQQGRFDVSWVLPAGDDEVARLSRDFHAMRHSLSAQQAEIRRLAHRDRLTGLPNRQRFADEVELALGRAEPGRPVAVLVFNLDRFKMVNEVLGYGLGDELLQAVAQRLQPFAGDDGVVARLGGDEFGVLLHGYTAERSAALARDMQDRLAQGVVINGQSLDVRASVGIAEGPRDAAVADSLVNRAEMAMRVAKRRLAGVQCFLPEHDTTRADTLSLLGDLRRGLARGELQLYLQPKTPLSGPGTLAAEALVRWLHPQQGLVSPGLFIPYAEQTGFVCELTRWMLEEVAATCARWRAQGVSCTVAVNVSARDLLDERFPLQVQSVLARHALPASALSLEITESAIMEDPQRAECTLQSLSALGVSLAIDDFGTGYSSLAYLKRLPVSVLKIDQTFVRDLSRQSNDAIIVRSTIDLAHSLGLEVVAEGVEDATTLERLQHWGCDWAQGYHVAAPMPVQRFAEWATAWQSQARPARRPAPLAIPG